MAKLKPEANKEYARLLNECVQAHEKYESLLPKPVAAHASGKAATSTFTEADLQLVQEADLQRMIARDALDRFRATHRLT